MGQTKIRISSQALFDADVNLNSTDSPTDKKITGLANGVNATDAVNKGQLDSATAGIQSGLHVPVADLAAGKAVGAAERTDKMMMLVETLGLYRYDAESAATTDDTNVFKPTDVSGNGRWIRMSVEMSNHENLSGLLGGAASDHQHLTSAQVTKLNGIEAGADVTDAGNVGSSIAGTTEKTAMIDADSFGIIDSAASNALKRITLGSLKTLLRTAWDSVYQLKSEKDATGGYVGLTLFKINFKNVANTFTSFFTNSNTAARTYTFPDKDGTVAMTSDITASSETTATIGALINGANAATPNDTDLVATADTSVLKKITWANVKAFFKTYFDTLYEKVANKDASNGYAGLTLLKINFKNVANTFTSYFTNTNTASRTYTFPDRDGTIADNTDITAAKARANHTGTQTASTISDFAAAALAAAPAETTATIGTLIGTTATAKATPVDADEIGISDSAASNVLKSVTWANVKATLKTYFDTVYNNYVHPNHTGDVTSVADGATTIAANAVTNAKLADMANSTIKGRVTAGSGDPEDLSVAQVKTLLGLNTANQSTRVYRAALTQVTSTSHTINVTNFISNTEEVFRNGVMLDNLGNDYSLNYVDNVIEIVLVTGLVSGEKLKINYSQSI